MELSFGEVQSTPVPMRRDHHEQVTRAMELKAGSTAQAQAGTMETQKPTWDGEKMGARNGKT